MKQCFYCGGQFGLTRRKLWGRQFCSLWCLAWFENAGRERKKAEEASSHTRFVDTDIASDSTPAVLSSTTWEPSSWGRNKLADGVGQIDALLSEGNHMEKRH